MKKIVIAQDIDAILKKKNTFLDRTDMRVFTVTTTDEVLDLHRKVHVDLIIIALDMPGMSSKQLCSQIREGEHGSVPIIVVCAHSRRVMERSSHCGANAVITRPIKPAQLLTKAKKLLKLSWRETYRVLLNVAIDGTVNDNRCLSCNSLDISLDGMLIETEQVFIVGDQIFCSFFLPDMSQVQTTGEIVRTITPAVGVTKNWYGVHFVDVSSEAEKMLETFIDANASKAPSKPGDKPA